MLPTRSPIEKATVTIDFSLENSQAAERKRDELAKAKSQSRAKVFVTSAESREVEDRKMYEPFLGQ